MKIIRNILVVAAAIALVVMGMAVYKYQYIKGYKEIELKKIAQCTDESSNVTVPYWTTLTSVEEIKNFETKYNVTLGDINVQDKMLIISYNAEITYMDYNLRETVCPSTKNIYVGFEQFGDPEPNSIFVYEADLLPISQAGNYCVAVGHRGKFRD